MQFTYTLALKGAQLNDPRGQKKNEGITRGVKPFLPPEAKPTIFTVFREKTQQNRADVFSLKRSILCTLLMLIIITFDIHFCYYKIRDPHASWILFE